MGEGKREGEKQGTNGSDDRSNAMTTSLEIPPVYNTGKMSNISRAVYDDMSAVPATIFSQGGKLKIGKGRLISPGLRRDAQPNYLWDRIWLVVGTTSRTPSIGFPRRVIDWTRRFANGSEVLVPRGTVYTGVDAWGLGAGRAGDLPRRRRR